MDRKEFDENSEDRQQNEGKKEMRMMNNQWEEMEETKEATRLMEKCVEYGRRQQEQMEQQNPLNDQKEPKKPPQLQNNEWKDSIQSLQTQVQKYAQQVEAYQKQFCVKQEETRLRESQWLAKLYSLEKSVAAAQSDEGNVDEQVSRLRAIEKLISRQDRMIQNLKAENKELSSMEAVEKRIEAYLKATAPEKEFYDNIHRKIQEVESKIMHPSEVIKTVESVTQYSAEEQKMLHDQSSSAIKELKQQLKRMTEEYHHQGGRLTEALNALQSKEDLDNRFLRLESLINKQKAEEQHDEIDSAEYMGKVQASIKLQEKWNTDIQRQLLLLQSSRFSFRRSFIFSTIVLLPCIFAFTLFLIEEFSRLPSVM